MIEKIDQPGSGNFKRIAKVVLSGVATIASFLFVAAILALIALAVLLFVAAGPVSADPLYNRWLLLLELSGQIGGIPIVYKLIFVSLFFLAVYRIFDWFKTRGENKSDKKEQMKESLIDNLKGAKDAIYVLFGTIVFLSLTIAIPALLRVPVDNYFMSQFSSPDVSEISNTANVVIAVTFLLFAGMVYVTWRFFAKKSFVAWLGATLLMTLFVVSMYFLV